MDSSYWLTGLAVVLLTFCTPVYAVANGSTNNEIPRTSQAIVIDGNANEEAWENALEISLEYEVAPGDNLNARIETSAYLLFDDEFLYVLVKANDPNPKSIRAYLSERDQIETSDYVSLSLDTFSDSRKAFKFSVNPKGVQADAIIDEITSVEDTGWDGIWYSGGRITKQGYQVELAIPFKSLRFEDKLTIKGWKIKLERSWPRDVVYSFSSVPNDRDNDCSLCQYQPVRGFANIRPASNIILIPALTFSQSENRERSSEDWQRDSVDDRASLDLRWGIDQNVYLNATINPDFSQVEADSLQLQVNKRFAIRNTEKRAFFLDGADYFSNWSKLIHTRLFTEPEYGVKVTGKTGAHSYGVIVLEDKDTNLLITDNQSSRLVRLDGVKSENQIIRYRFDAENNANLGFTYTQRHSGDYSNKVFSVDGKYWFNPSTYFKFQTLTTETNDYQFVRQDYFGSDRQTLDSAGDAYSFNLTHVNRDWSTSLTHHRFEDDVRIDAGFVSRSDWVTTSLSSQYRWYPKSNDSWWKKIEVDYTLSEVTDIKGQRLNLFRQGGVDIYASLQSYLGVWFYDDTQRFVQQKLLASVNPNLYLEDYQIKVYELYGGFSPLAGLELEMFYEWGKDVDFSSAELGKLETIKASARYQLNEHWRLQLEQINQNLIVQDEPAFDVHLTNLRVAYQLDVEQSIRLTLQSQRQGSDKSLASQLLYTYKIDPFTLFYLGYSDQALADSENMQLARVERTLFVKFSYAWQL